MSEGGADEGDGSSMIVPSSQMNNFLSTLKQYSDTCASNRKLIDEKVKGCMSRMDKHDAACKEHSARMEENVNKMESMWKKQRDAIAELKVECEKADNMVSKLGEYSREMKRIIGSMEVKESFVCSFVDIVKQAETMTLFQYTRSVYAGTICKEATKCALSALEAALKLLESSPSIAASSSSNNRGGQDGDMVDDVSTVPASSNSKLKIQSLLVRYAF